MSNPITEEQVRHIAHLSRLNLSDAEVTLFAAQLGNILEYIGKLNEVDVTGVEPLAHPLPVTNVLRDDIPQPSFTTETALANAPSREGDFFRVPKVLDSGA